MHHSRKKSKSVVVATRGVTIRDFLVFQVKLAMEGARDFLAMNLSLIALVIDLLSGRGRRPRRFYAVVRWSQRFDRWLRLHSMKGMPDADGGERTRPLLAAEDDDPADAEEHRSNGPDRRLGSDADTLVEQFEQLVQDSRRR